MGEYEGMRLLSFRRYVELLSVPIQCIIVLQLIQIGWLQRFRLVNRLSEAWKRVGQGNRTRTGGMAFALGISLCLISFFRPLFAQKSDPLLEASIRAVNVLPNLESNKKQMLVISQGDDGRVFVRLRYSALVSHKDGLVLYGSWSFGPSAENVWMQIVTDSEFEELLSQMDFIWVHRSNAWLQERLRPMVDPSTCNLEEDGWMLIRQASGNTSFDCKSSR
jgi:hypothetical protein